MSKLGKVKKLIRSPKKFFLDSWLFRTEDFLEIGNYKNLFIISHLGQLHQVESLIEIEKLEECFLVILWTKKNIKMPKLVQNSINKNLISNSMLLLLPNSPNNYKLKSLRLMQNNYNKLIDTVNPQNLYMLSFENHYVLLSDYAKKNNIPINLIDEGTGSYKSREQSEYKVRTNLLKKILGNFLGLSAVENWYTEYDKVYASFPELLKGTFKANEYIKFSAHSGKFNLDIKTKKLIDYYGITNNDFLYVNQRYAIKDKDFVEAIIEILNKISIYQNSKVFIKMHPKDTDSIKNAFIQEIKSFKNIIFIKENEFLIEPTIQAVNPKGVIGLTSTSLVYAPLVSPNTKVYSIKPWFTNLVPMIGNEKGIEIINDHFDILKQFKHVVYIESENSLDSINDDILTLEINNNTTKYEKIAKKSYEESKYQKAIVNYGWAYPKGIESMPIEDFVKYLECFNSQNEIKQTQEIIQKWIDTEILRDTKNELSYYITLIKEIVNIIDKNQEYGYQIDIELLYNNILALITSTIDKIEYSINQIDEEIFLLKNYEEYLLPLLILKAKKYMLDNKYIKAKEIVSRVFKYESYLSENEDNYIYLLECLIKLDEKESIYTLTDEIEEKVKTDEIKVIANSMILNYEKEYTSVVELIVSKIDSFTDKIKETLKPELILAKAYRYLGDYQEAKSYLVQFEKHSKGNLYSHKEIAYLEYSVNKYKIAISQFNKAYPKGIESMPIEDFVKYLECFNSQNEIKQTQEIIQKWIDTEILRDTKNELSYYITLIKEIVNIIDKNQEYGYQIDIELLYNNILALITSTIDKIEYSINQIDEEIFLLKNYEEYLLPLLILKAKKYMLDNKYIKAKEIVSRVFKYESYLSENEDNYIYLLECLIKLDEKESIYTLTDEIEEKVKTDEIKVIANSMILNYEKEYTSVVELIVSKIDSFTDKIKETLKPELILAKAYRYLGDYQEAKSYLVQFEKHSKGNLYSHKEIAYLEYSVNKYKIAISQFNKAYPKGIESMPIEDFVKYLECFYIEKEYKYIISLDNNLNYDELNYFYLASLNKESLYSKFIEELEKIGELNVSKEKKDLILFMLIKAFREVGLIDKAMELIDNSIVIKDLNYLINIAEIYELSNEFKKANDIWKLIIKDFNKEKPSYSWDRYYKTLENSGLVV
ncbi:MAG: alpha-2,8-polysialyltransferase family protein [Campylobacterota bacterium]|nr:alpha-2,8-polysialyltransferase family protein [Campylobacterota bacterium]